MLQILIAFVVGGVLFGTKTGRAVFGKSLVAVVIALAVVGAIALLGR